MDRISRPVREAPLVDYIDHHGVPPYDGRYEFDLEGRELTTREWGWIKRLSRLPAVERSKTGCGDPELIAVLRRHRATPRRQGRSQRSPQACSSTCPTPPSTAPRSRLETDTVEEGDADSPPPSSSSSNGATSGPGSPTSSETIDGDPGGLWDARLGFFSVSPGDVGDMTPAQLLGCVDLFAAMHGAE